MLLDKDLKFDFTSRPISSLLDYELNSLIKGKLYNIFQYQVFN